MQNAAEAKSSPDSSTPDPLPGKPSVEAETQPIEIGGPTGPEPTRYGDWEKKGRCIDF